MRSRSGKAAPRAGSTPQPDPTWRQFAKKLLAGDFVRAEGGHSGKNDGRPERHQTKPNQTLGDLWIRAEGHESVESFRRSLDLRDAGAVTSYAVGRTTFTRRVFVSHPAQALYVDAQAERGTWPSLTFQLNRPARFGTRVDGGQGMLILPGSTEGRLRFASDGQLDSQDDLLRLSNASWYVVRLSSATTYRGRINDPVGECMRILAAAPTDAKDAFASHSADFRSLFDRCVLTLESGEQHSERPMDERIHAVREGGTDVGLDRLLFDFGRYLLISSSRPGCLPANLQGKWNPLLDPPWEERFPRQYQPSDELLAG